MTVKYRKVVEFKTAADFSAYLRQENIHINLVPELPHPADSVMTRPVSWNGRTVGNRWAILPMEGWDCMPDGNPSDLTRRRWLNFAGSGAKLLFGTEAAAVMHEGRSNPRQLMIADHTVETLKNLVSEMRKLHRRKFGRDDDLCIGLQLTHSGRFAHPNQADRLESRTAYCHPLLDRKFGSTPECVVSDEEVREIIRHFIHAGVLAQQAGFDFVDIKHAHGYLGHEFLTAVDRPGPYGGSFENRTRFFREIAEGIRRAAPGLEISSRISLFDIFPFVKGEDGVGHAMEWKDSVYPYAFGGDGTGFGMDPELTEPVKLVKMMEEYGVGLICSTIGSPYYNVHMQRPAYFPVCDGYEMPENPLYNVSRHQEAVRVLKRKCPEILTVGAGYTCLQDYLPHAAEYAVAHGETDFVGIGRMVLSYPEMCADLLAGRKLERCRICRTIGDCTNAPRNGLVSGCYPLDEFYRKSPEAIRLRELKKQR